MSDSEWLCIRIKTAEFYAKKMQKNERKKASIFIEIKRVWAPIKCCWAIKFWFIKTAAVYALDILLSQRFISPERNDVTLNFAKKLQLIYFRFFQQIRFTVNRDKYDTWMKN